MKRLTIHEIKEYIIANYFDGDENVDACVDGDEEITVMANIVKSLEKLAEYEDAEENGTLIKLPCKVGDKVYPLSYGYYQEYIIVSVNYSAEAGSQYCEFEIESADHEAYDTFELDDIGNRVFFDKDERDKKFAECIRREEETALEKMKGEYNA